MIQLSEAEILRNFFCIYNRLDKCRDMTIQIKQDIYRLNNEKDVFSMIQPADERASIAKRLSYVNRQLFFAHNELMTIKTITNNYLEQDKTNNRSMRILLQNTEKRFRYAFERHASNVRYAIESLNLYTETPVFA